MKLSLREVMGKAVNAYPNTKRNEWVLQWPGQIVLAASQVHWTAEVTQVKFRDDFFIFYFIRSFIVNYTICL